MPVKHILECLQRCDGAVKAKPQGETAAEKQS